MSLQITTKNTAFTLMSAVMLPVCMYCLLGFDVLYPYE